MAALPKIGADYGAGFSDQILVGGVPLHTAYPGQVFWVDENASHTGRGTFKNPDTTVDAAYNRCVAGRGDIVMVKPGHSETSGAAGSSTWYTADVDDVAVVGLGRGANQAEWKQSTDTGSHLIVTGTDNALIGFRIENTIDDLDGCITVTPTTGDGFMLANNYIYCAANLGYENFLSTTTSGYSNLYIYDNFVDLTLDDDGESFIFLHDAFTGLRMVGNTIMGFFSVGNIDADASTFTNMYFQDNKMINTDTDPGLCVLIGASTKAYFFNERYAGGKSNTVPVSNSSASYFLNCHGIDAPNAGSLVFPAVGAWS